MEPTWVDPRRAVELTPDERDDWRKVRDKLNDRELELMIEDYLNGR
jgi:hypothetical protein